MKLQYKDVFKPGDFVECLEDVEVLYGVGHVKGEWIQVNEETVYYYNFHTHLYKLVLREEK